jgi:SNF family Na+-dependent transporter
LANNIFLLGGGLALALFVGWWMPDPEAEVASGAREPGWLSIWRNLLRFAVPAFLGFVLFFAIPSTWDTLAALF